MITTDTNEKFLKIDFEEILNRNGQPVHCIIALGNDNGAPVIEIVQPFQEDGNGDLVNQNIRIEVKSKEIADLHSQLAAEIKEIAYLKAELESAKAHIAYITTPPAALNYSELTEVAMVQANGEINGWNTLKTADIVLYATRKTRAEAHPHYLAILNSCRSSYRADQELEAMNARFEQLMDEMAAAMTPEQKLTLDEEIALGLYDEDHRADADAAEWEARVARDEVEADERAARQEEEAGEDPFTRRRLEEDMIHDHFAEQWSANQD